MIGAEERLDWKVNVLSIGLGSRQVFVFLGWLGRVR
jgi:hypothetical protein